MRRSLGAPKPAAATTLRQALGEEETGRSLSPVPFARSPRCIGAGPGQHDAGDSSSGGYRNSGDDAERVRLRECVCGNRMRRRTTTDRVGAWTRTNRSAWAGEWLNGPSPPSPSPSPSRAHEGVLQRRHATQSGCGNWTPGPGVRPGAEMCDSILTRAIVQAAKKKTVHEAKKRVLSPPLSILCTQPMTTKTSLDIAFDARHPPPPDPGRLQHPNSLAVVLLACAFPLIGLLGNWGREGCLGSTEGPVTRESPATGDGQPGVSHTGGQGTRYSAEFSGDAAFPRLTDLLGNGVVHDSLAP